jgi:hypothetical protein
MKIDPDYIKQVLTKAQASDKAIFNIYDLVDDKNEISDEKFIFHMQILSDKKLLVTDSDNSLGIGVSRTGYGQVSWKVTHLRLTSTGHDFIEALTNDTVWKKIKKELKAPSITTLVNTAQFLLQETIKSQMN